MARAGSHDGKYGQTDTAHNPTFNLSDSAFDKGLENAGYEWPEAADGATVDATYGSDGGETQVGRFGSNGVKAYPSGNASAIFERYKGANDPNSATQPFGTKGKRYK